MEVYDKYKEYSDLVKDYKDCNKYLRELDKYNYIVLSNWAEERYSQWILKDEKYAFSVTEGTVPPRDERERAVNTLTNFKTTLEKIALINGITL